MKILIQRVKKSSVCVDGDIVGKIGCGLCVLVGIEQNDTEKNLSWMAEKLVHLRIFEDENGKMNKSVLDQGGSLLLISQFTLLADCSAGRRPSFTKAGSPQHANDLFLKFIRHVQSFDIPVQTGIFGANMTVEIINDGPATFMIESPAK